jgi:hypothetical protein
MEYTIKLKLTTEQALEMLREMPEEARRFALEDFVFTEIVEAVERQLKHDSEQGLYSWDTKGYRDGAKMREAILKFQGLEPEFKADLESRIRSLEHDVEHYKLYYDWHFKVWHDDDLRDLVGRKVGWPK